MKDACGGKQQVSNVIIPTPLHPHQMSFHEILDVVRGSILHKGELSKLDCILHACMLHRLLLRQQILLLLSSELTSLSNGGDVLSSCDENPTSVRSESAGWIDPRTELTRGMFEGFDGGGIDSENDGWRVESFCECRVVAFLDSIHFETRSRS